MLTRIYKSKKDKMKKIKILCTSLLFILFLQTGYGQNNAKPSDQPFTIENYYKVKWGFADEFIVP